MNLTILQGNLGADPELRFTQAGQAVMSMRLCTTETFLDKNNVKQERNEWHSLTLWGKRAEALSKFLVKGTKILVQGHLHYSSYDDKDGVKRYKTEIIVDQVEFAGGKRADEGGGERGSGRQQQNRSGSGGGGSRSNSQSQRNDEAPEDDFGGGGDDDIPF